MYLLAQLPVQALKEQLANGVILMILGMAIVFVFLTILVFTTKVVSKVVGKIESKKPAVKESKVEIAAPATSNDAEIAAAIAAAFAKSRT